MKVLLLVPGLKGGGVTTIVNSMALNLQSESHDVKVVSLRKDNGVVDNLAMSSKLDIIKALLQFRTIVAQYGPDIIHSHTIFAHIIALLYKLIFNKKICVINTEHNTQKKNENKKIVFTLFKILAKNSNAITFVSKFSEKSYIDNKIVNIDKSRVIYNGIKFNSYFDEKELDLQLNKGFRFCYIGRFSKEKNLILLLESFKLLQRINKNINLYLIGDGEEKDYLQDYCSLNNIENVVFCGFRKDVDNILSRMDCLVLSSLTEGLPMVVLEAYAKNILVVSTDCGGVKEIVSDKNFIAQNDNVESLTQRMNYVLNLDEKTTDKLKKENFDRCKIIFSSDAMFKTYKDLYKEVLNVN